MSPRPAPTPSRPGRGARRSRPAAENALTGALRSLFAVVENYPELKANENVLEPPGAADHDREPDQLLAPALQRDRPRLQHDHRDVPQPAHRGPVRVHPARVLRRGARGGRRPDRRSDACALIPRAIAAERRAMQRRRPRDGRDELLPADLRQPAQSRAAGAHRGWLLGAARASASATPPRRRRRRRSRSTRRVCSSAFIVSIAPSSRATGSCSPRRGAREVNRPRTPRSCSTSSRRSRSRRASRCRGSTSSTTRRPTPSPPAVTRSTPRSRSRPGCSRS